jgi:hypothetical protein
MITKKLKTTRTLQATTKNTLGWVQNSKKSSTSLETFAVVTTKKWTGFFTSIHAWIYLTKRTTSQRMHISDPLLFHSPKSLN